MAFPRHTQIYLNALAAVIIPRRAFANPAKFATFVRTAEDSHRSALRPPPQISR